VGFENFEAGLGKVSVLLEFGVQAVQFGRLDRRDDRRGPFGVFADGKFLSLAECGFERGLLREELLDACSVLAFDAVADGDVVRALRALANLFSFAGQVGIRDAGPGGV
jgi:hypothetical protein